MKGRPVKPILFILAITATLSGCPSQIFLDPPRDDGASATPAAKDHAPCVRTGEAVRDKQQPCKEDDKD